MSNQENQYKSIKHYLDHHKLHSYEDIKRLLENKDHGLNVKDNGNLYMITYYDGKSNFDNPITHKCRGVILEKDTNNIVCYSFDRSIDFINDLSYLNNKFPFNDKTVVQESIDGTQIKLFYYGDKWLVATTRSIDAYSTRFSSRSSFGKMFDDALELSNLNLETLNKRKCYSFVLCHPDNRIITKYEKPDLVHVFTRDLDTLEIDLSYDVGVRKPQTLDYEGYEKLLEDSNDLEYYKEGFVLHSGDEQNKMMKIKSKNYLKCCRMRGNNNNILFHYLELRFNDYQNIKYNNNDSKNNNIKSTGLNISNDELEKINDELSNELSNESIYSTNIENFLQYFNEYREIFKLFEDNIRALVKFIHVEYICRFVNKTIETKDISWYYRPIIFSLHTNYYNTKKKTSYNQVLNMINHLHPAQLCFLYNNTFNNKKARNVNNSKKTQNKNKTDSKNQNTTTKENISNSQKRKQKRRHKRYTDGYNTSDSYNTSSGSGSSSDSTK